MHRFTTQDGPAIVNSAAPMLKKPNPVYMHRQTEAFEVETNEGTLTGKPGDYVAHDPISGHVWPVSADYVAQHYVPIGEVRAADREIEAWFTYHAPTPDQQRRLVNVRDAARVFAYVIRDNTLKSADQTAALRKLREAVTTANASIVLEGKL